MNRQKRMWIPRHFLYLLLNLALVQDGSAQTASSGLLANILNQHPTGEGPLSRNFCCCATGSCPPTAPTKSEDYDDDINDADLVGTGLINPRVKVDDEGASSSSSTTEKASFDIAVRIVNNPPPPKSAPILGAQCAPGLKTCCYSSKDYVTSLGNRCVPAAGGDIKTAWRQGCNENAPKSPSGKQCGQRLFKEVSGLKPGEANPDEFPWTCLLLTGSNDFVGGCAIVPDSGANDISAGTRRVITVAHKLANLKRNEQLKVRVLEYDASGFTTKETVKHQEYTVVRFLKHPRYDPKRISDDIAVLFLDRPIDLTQNNGVNAACLPACRNMFEYFFSNGTGTRCWVAGWGKDSSDGDFQFLQHKVDVPIFDRQRCEPKLKSELTKVNADLAKRFFLHPGELCAGGEKGKDACEGDGGSPLVCQSESGLFHVVGLVAWGVDCALEDVPGVYVNIYNYLDFISQRP